MNLDSGDIHSEKSNCFPEMFAAQREWLKEVMETEACRTATFRVMIVHAPTHGQSDGEASLHERMRNYLGDLLNNPDPEKHFQLCLGGHEHRYFRFNAHGTENLGEEPLEGSVLTNGKDFNYTVMINGGPLGGNWEFTAMDVESTPGKLSVKLFNGLNGETIDHIEVAPDGTVTELGMHKK